MCFRALKNRRNVWLYDRYILPQSQERQTHFGNLIYGKVTAIGGYFIWETSHEVCRESHTLTWGHACDLTWRLASFDITCIPNHPGSHLNRGKTFSIMLHESAMPERHFQSVVVNDDTNTERGRAWSLWLLCPSLKCHPTENMLPPPHTLNLIWCQTSVKPICLSCSRYVIQLRNLAGDSRSWRNPNPQEAWCIRPFAT